MINTTLDDLAAEIGFTATLTLVAWYAYSGNSLYIPEVAKADQPIARLVGLSVAQRLSKRWPRVLLTIPTLSLYENEVRRNFIARMLEKGFTTREVAYRLNMSERRVQQICQEMESQGLVVIVAAKTPREKAGEKIRGKTAQENAPQKAGGKRRAPSPDELLEAAAARQLVDKAMRSLATPHRRSSKV